MKKVSNKKEYGILIGMIMISILTQVVNLVKGATVAQKFGATVDMDAFNFTQSISNFIFSFLATGITTVLVPAYISKNSQKAINSFISLIYGACIVVIIIINIFKYPLICMFSSGSQRFIEIALEVFLVNMLANFILYLNGVTNAFFQCKEKFIIPKLMNLLTMVLTVVLIFSIEDISILKYTYILLISAIVSSLVQIVLAIKNDFRFFPEIKFKDETLKKMVGIFIPTVFSTGLYQISLLTDSMISSNLGEGQLSVLNYANSIMSLVSTLIISNLITYVYPKISVAINNNDEEESQKRFFDYIILFFCVMCLIVVAFIIVGEESVKILYERGKFTSTVTRNVFLCTVLYMIGMPINVARDLVYRYFYAKGDTKTTLKNSVIISILNIVISILLAKIIGIYGIILGTVITSYMSLSMILKRYKENFGLFINVKEFLGEITKVFLISVITTVGVLVLKKQLMFIPNVIISIVVYGIIVTVLYIGLCYILKSRIFKIKL